MKFCLTLVSVNTGLYYHGKCLFRREGSDNHMRLRDKCDATIQIDPSANSLDLRSLRTPDISCMPRAGLHLKQMGI